MKPFSYARATDLADAFRHLRAGAVPLAGGTDLLGLMKAGIVAPEKIVDLGGIAELRGWSRTRGKGLRIGPLTPLVELETAADLGALVPLIAECLRPAATPQLRTMGTAGGNLLQENRCWYFRDEAFPCWRKGGTRCFAIDGESRQHAILGAEECVAVSPSDLAPALIALDAEVTLRTARGTRTIPLAALYVAPLPWRARAAEGLLEGRGLDEAACAAAADAALEGAVPLRDNGYKVPLARELVRRTLRRIA